MFTKYIITTSKNINAFELILKIDMSIIVVGTKQFKNQTDFKNFARSILNKYIFENQTISEEDTLFFIDVLKLREDAGATKIGCGIKRMFLRNNKYGGRGIWIERIDGTETDFSIYKPIGRKTNGVKYTQKEIDFQNACRTAIVEDKKKLKRETNSFGDAHHCTHFKNMVCEFKTMYSINPENLLFVGHEDGNQEILFADKVIENAWVEYHRRNVKWEVLSKCDHKQKHNNR